MSGMSGVDPRERVQARSGSTGPVEPGAGAAVSPGDSSVAAALPTDRLGRTLRDLRISVTDRCNFRCTYCMPKEVFGRDYEFLPRSELLSFDELERLTRVFVALGVSKVRLTGGEPLVRRDLERLVAKLSAIEGLDDLTLTTNGSLLDAKAAALRAAGLRRLTVSLDSLDDHVFARLNDVDFPVARVLAGIEAAEAAGFRPIKINMVVRRGVNEESIVPMARYFRERGHILRFIEYMDVGHTNGWRLDEVVPAAEVIARVDAEMPLEPEPPNYPGEVATRWRYRDGGGEVGMISSVTQPFCGSCTRARITADGKLWTCLFATTGHDLRALLRSGATEEEIRQDIDRVWRGRTDRYSEIRGLLTIPLAPTGTPPRVEMSHIGG